MKKNILYTLILILFFACTPDKTDEELIQENFDAYKTAILSGDGATASQQIDKKTLNYYNDLLKNILSSDSTTVEALPILNKMLVLSIRAIIPKEDILKMDERQLFQRAVEEGMISKQGVESLALGEMAINLTDAKVQMLTQGQTAPLSFHFNKEGSDWKLDLTPIFDSSVDAVNQFIGDRGITEKEFIYNSIQQLTKKPVRDEIWVPLKK